MKLLKKLLMPALMFGSFLGGAAAAEEKAPLPDAPSAVNSFRLKSMQPNFSYVDAHAPTFEYKVLPPSPSSTNPLGDGFIGKIAAYVDRHSNESQAPFDFAMGYKLKDRFTLMAGTLSDPRTHSGKYEADRRAMHVMTGLPDWQTRSLRDAMSGGMQNRHQGGDGFAIGIKIQLGPKP